MNRTLHIGNVYKHYKGNTYRVLGTLNNNNNDILVLYTSSENINHTKKIIPALHTEENVYYLVDRTHKIFNTLKYIPTEQYGKFYLRPYDMFMDKYDGTNYRFTEL